MTRHEAASIQPSLPEARQRRVRELHDAVTQALFSASLIAETVPQIWETDRAKDGCYSQNSGS